MRTPFSLVHIAECASTNISVLEYPTQTVLWADCQTQGKGRRGHSWESPKGSGLYFSLYLNQKANTTLPLSSALAVWNALTKLGAGNLFLKWPNDIFFKNQKIGGILVEQYQENCVVGIGLNLKTPNIVGAPYPLSDLTQAFLPQTLPNPQQMVESIVQECALQFQQTFCAQKWQSHALWLNQIVQLRTENGNFEGTFLGINDDGALLLSGFSEVFYSGSLRCPSCV